MLTWESLSILHRNPPNFKITRDNEVQKRYDEFINKIKMNNIDINKYISDKFLNNKNVNFTKNSYPYDIEEDCNHYIIWFENEYFNKITLCIDENKIIDNIIKSKFKNNKYIYFENVDNNKSIKKIKHFHVFIKD